ncbi:hypothetical protein SLS61_005058 [Didymella pomorum]
MNDITPVETHGSTTKGTAQVEEDVYENPQGSSSRVADENGASTEVSRGMFRRRPKPKQTYSHTHFKVYNRRWLGLAQLVLLNIVVSWDIPENEADRNKLAQLINPFLGSVDKIVLIVSIIATVSCIPSIFLPSAPPTPPSASSSLSKTGVFASIGVMLRSPPFYIVFLTFSVYVGLFNSFSSLLNQILYPYGFSEDEAGICGAVLIVVGLVVAGIISPVLDRTHAYLLGIKILCPLVAGSYLAMVWAPQTRGIVAPYVLSAVLGASSFSLLPIALEYLVEISFPASPEVSSTICWVGGQFFGACFVLIMDALKDKRDVDLTSVNDGGRIESVGDRPPGNMYNALVFEAVVAMVVLPLPLMLGVKKLGLASGEGRLKVDEHREGSVVEGQES